MPARTPPIVPRTGSARDPTSALPPSPPRRSSPKSERPAASATRCAPAPSRGPPAGPAATSTAKVGTACGISQRALLVLLQKEQGLVTASGTSLTPVKYRSATGYGCPDGADCDVSPYGLLTQPDGAGHRATGREPGG